MSVNLESLVESARRAGDVDEGRIRLSEPHLKQQQIPSYYARREQWLPTRLLVAPRSLKDELRLLCANNSLAQQALLLEIPLETAGLDRKPRRSARSPPPLRHPRDVALWNRKPLSDAPKARFPPHNHKSTDGAHDQRLMRQRGSL